MKTDREFEVVVWGATGFTGRLVAEHLSQHYGDKHPLRWALGGRDHGKLTEVASQLPNSTDSPPIVIGDSFDRASLNALASRTSTVCSTVGPYAKYGSELVAACVEQGTHYCDLSGEVQWMREMLDRHETQARETGARIVHCCGFDSVPSDLGCFFLQQQVRSEQSAVCEQVKLRVRGMRGTFSGGTVASLLNILDESRRDSRVRQIVSDPYALNPSGERSGPDGRDSQRVRWDQDLKTWIAPFMMAPINTRVVRRTNALLDFTYGRNFRYEEAVVAGSGVRGWARAQGMAKGWKLFLTAASIGPSRAALERWFLPQPGDGPSDAERKQGFFKIQLIGKPHVDATEFWTATVSGNRDPGYGSTSKMLAECAVCLAQDAEQLPVSGGFWTPASGLGMHLLERLEARAGMRFECDVSTSERVAS